MLSPYIRLLGRCTSIRSGRYLSAVRYYAARVGPHLDSSGRAWYPIYRFKWIPLASAIGRVKLAQTAFTVLLIPVAAVAFHNGVISWVDLSSVIFIALFALVMLYVMSYGLRRTIGVISVDHNASVLRIGYLDFWGKRRNVILPVADVIPLSDANVTPADYWAPVQRLSDKNFLLFLPLKHMEIVDEEKFYSIFGHL